MVDCNLSGVLEIILLIKTLLKFMQYAIPIVLILVSMIDIVKMVFSGTIEIAKTLSKIGKRILIAICAFLILPILNFCMNLLGKTSIEASKCWQDANEETIAKKKEEEAEKEKEEALKRQADIADLAAALEEAIKQRKEIVWNKPSKNPSSEVNDFPYYNQGRDPWRNVPFCGSNRVGDSGCGATSLAMIFSGISKKEANPEMVANWMCSNGHAGGAMPDSMAMNSRLLSNFHVKGNILWPRGGAPAEGIVKEKMLENVKDGKALLVLVPGHFVAVVKGKEKDFYLLDPGDSSKVGEYSASELYSTLYDYKNRCSNMNNCGLKAVWAYEKE